MRIDIADYFSEQEVQKIAEEELRAGMREKLNQNDSSILVNAVYHAVQNVVDAEISARPELQELIVEKTKGAITKLSSYTVFNKADAYSKRRGLEDSLGQQILEDEVVKRRERIGGRVNALIENMGYRDIKSLVTDAVDQLFTYQEDDCGLADRLV